MSSVILLAATVDGRWRPGIGDPTVLGWATAAAYLVAAVVCGKTFRREREAKGAGERTASPTFWLILTALLVFLGINKQLDLQTLMVEVGKRLAKGQGWYARRHEVQVAFIVLVAAASTSAFLGFAWIARKDLKRRATALAGIIVLLTFVLIRASAFHHVDALVAQSFAGVRWNAIMELGGIALTALGGLVALRRRAR